MRETLRSLHACTPDVFMRPDPAQHVETLDSNSVIAGGESRAKIALRTTNDLAPCVTRHPQRQLVPYRTQQAGFRLQTDAANRP